MIRTLSSWRVLASQLVAFPLIFDCVVAITVHHVWEPEYPPIVALSGALIFAGFLVTMVNLSAVICMKSVTLEGDRLLVRGFFRSDVVEMSDVTNVFQNFWFPVKGVWPVVIHLASPSRFGSHILFVPKWDADARKRRVKGREWVEYDVVRELRELSRCQTTG